MKTSAVTHDDLIASVISVPPLARKADLSVDAAENAKLIRHLEAGGVRTMLYGGNANLYNMPVSETAATMEVIAQAAGKDTWVIPSAGPDFGKMMDQAAIYRDLAFPTVMVLPNTFPHTMTGVATGLRKFAEKFGRPIVAYIKGEGYIEPKDVAALVNDGLIASVKYAIVREDPSKDEYLSRLVDTVDRRYLVSGIGERPAIVHLRDFGLSGFTSGSVCVAPALSMAILKAVQAKDYGTAETLRQSFMPLEDLRDGLSPIRVLHEAVTLSGVANMGPMLPLLSNIDAQHHAAIEKAARELLAKNAAFVPGARKIA